ncbi:MAG: glycosyltransferase family 2 protein [Candidatus Solibacter usitatus]|nr:glycosyltransferase family 2 protein [Candidatus Solibacter usitatus]
MTPRVSVLVPLYNKADHIRRCIDSVLEQTYADFELIVVDDGSTDGSGTIVAEYRDPRLRMIHQKNAGPGAARNRGAKEARAEWLAMVDADDAWEKDYLEHSLHAVESLPKEVVSYTSGLLEYPGRVSTAARWRKHGVPEGVFRATPATAPAIVIAILANTLPTCTVMRKAEFLAEGGFYEAYRCVYSEDAWLYLRMLLRYPMAFHAEPHACRFVDASELSIGHARARPIEPFLLNPETIETDCPPEMRPLLRTVLAMRALKTASVYGFYGERKTARSLWKRFVSLRDWHRPYFWTALAACTPAAGWAGFAARKLDLRLGKTGAVLEQGRAKPA